MFSSKLFFSFDGTFNNYLLKTSCLIAKTIKFTSLQFLSKKVPHMPIIVEY